MAFLSMPLMGCIFTSVEAPLSYRSPTPSDVPPQQVGGEGTGRACSHEVLWLVAWGDGGYRAAMEDAKKQSGAQTLVDMKSDTDEMLVLAGVYGRRCTVVTGKVVK